MRETLQPAFVLHRRPYRDTSMLLEVLSRDYGRVGLIARGARGPKSRSKGLLQPLQPLLLSWSGKGDLSSLSGCEAAAGGALSASPLVGERLLCALYLNELLLRLLTRFDPQPRLFAGYREALEQLAAIADAGGVLRLFEKRLLDELGYGLQLTHTADDARPVQPGRRYVYAPQRGPLEVALGDEAGADGSPCCGETLLALAAERLDDPQTLREARPLLRQALGEQLGEKPLQTRELLNDYRRRRAQRV